MTSHSSILARRIPWTEEPGGLQSTGSQRVRHNWTTEYACRQHSERCDAPVYACFLLFCCTKLHFFEKLLFVDNLLLIGLHIIDISPLQTSGVLDLWQRLDWLGSWVMSRNSWSKMPTDTHLDRNPSPFLMGSQGCYRSSLSGCLAILLLACLCLLLQ